MQNKHPFWPFFTNGRNPFWFFIVLAIFAIVCGIISASIHNSEKKDKLGKVKVAFIIPESNDSSIYILQKGPGWGCYLFKSANGKFKIGEVVDVFSISKKKYSGYIKYDVEQ